MRGSKDLEVGRGIFYAQCARWTLSLFMAYGLLSCGIASAQWDAGASLSMSNNTGMFMQGYLGTTNLNNSVGAANRKRLGSGYSRSAPAPVIAAPRLGVTYDPAISAEANRSYIDGVRSGYGDGIARAFAAEFERKDVRSAFRDLVRPYGLRLDNYGDVFAGYIATLWSIANQAPAPRAAQVRALSAQASTIFARSLGDDRHQRQLDAERMMYEAVSATYGREEMERVGDRAGLERMAMQARNKFLRSGMDLQAMVFSERGLVRR